MANDYDINKYSINELRQIFNLNDEYTEVDLQNSISKSIEINTRMNNEEAVTFADQAGQRLLAFLNGEDAEDDPNKTWLSTDAIDGYTDSANASGDTVASIHPNPDVKVLHRETTVQSQQGVPIIQGAINPNLTNQYTRTVNIDSSKRRNILPYKDDNPDFYTSPTNYTMRLDNPLTNVLSYSLSNVTIPFTFYPFDRSRGNNFFWCSIYPANAQGTIPTYNPVTRTASFTDTNGTEVTAAAACENIFLELPSAAYNNATIAPALTAALTTQLTEKVAASGSQAIIPVISCEVNADDLRLRISGTNYQNIQYLVVLLYYDLNEGLNIDITGSASCSRAHKLDSCLGWKLGCRTMVSPTSPLLFNSFTTSSEPLIFESPIDLNPSPYMVLTLDDGNYNYVENGEMNVTDTLPLSSQHTERQRDLLTAGEPDCGRYQFNGEELTTPTYPLEYPRRKTLNQLIALNARNFRANNIYNNFRSYGVNLRNTFSIISYNLSGASFGTQLASFGSPLDTTIPANSTRQFFGPVTIDRFKIRLVGSDGSTVNLHGNNWSFQLSVTQLYQY